MLVRLLLPSMDLVKTYGPKDEYFRQFNHVLICFAVPKNIASQNSDLEFKGPDQSHGRIASQQRLAANIESFTSPARMTETSAAGQVKRTGLHSSIRRCVDAIPGACSPSGISAGSCAGFSSARSIARLLVKFHCRHRRLDPVIRLTLRVSPALD